MATLQAGSSSHTRQTSHGRGGAGNIARDGADTYATPESLTTPTIKGEHYTTGRGGTGNIAKNDPNHPEIARARQDVEAPPHREPEGDYHVGRGGAANVARTSVEEPRSKSTDRGTKEEKGWADKGKELLGKLGGHGSKN